MKTKWFNVGTTALCSLVILFLLAGCASPEQPNYQGRSGAVPKIGDYYPDKSSPSSNDPLKPSPETKP